MTRLTILFTLLLGISMTGQSQDWSDVHNTGRKHGYGIVGNTGPELRDNIQWVDGNGKATTANKLGDAKTNYKVIYGFQAWCPGCHSRGLPSLKKMVNELEGNDKVSFMAIQTVFEGSASNTYERMQEIQKEYDLQIPFGHDPGDATSRNRSGTMVDYRTGGTPWFIILDENNKVVFNDYHLDTDKAIEILKEATEE